MKDSLDELCEWSGRDRETIREVAAMKRKINQSGGEVVLTADEAYTADKLADYFIRHRNLIYLQEIAETERILNEHEHSENNQNGGVDGGSERDVHSGVRVGAFAYGRG